MSYILRVHYTVTPDRLVLGADGAMEIRLLVASGTRALTSLLNLISFRTLELTVN